MSKLSLFLLLLFAFPDAGFAQSLADESAASMAMQGRHAVQLSAGLLNWSVSHSVSVGNVDTDTGSSGFVGSIGYSYWIRDDVAIGISVGAMDVGTSNSVRVGDITSKSAVVGPVLFGVTYYPPALAIRPNLCPFVSWAVGPYIGSSTNTRVGVGVVASESVTDTAFGGRLLVGVDWFTGRWFKLGIGGGYHFVSDFDHLIGSDDNYSGPEFSMGFGVVFGKGR